jgi:hypothetical protein
VIKPPVMGVFRSCAVGGDPPRMPKEVSGFSQVTVLRTAHGSPHLLRRWLLLGPGFVPLRPRLAGSTRAVVTAPSYGRMSFPLLADPVGPSSRHSQVALACIDVLLARPGRRPAARSGGHESLAWSLVQECLREYRVSLLHSRSQLWPQPKTILRGSIC